MSYPIEGYSDEEKATNKRGLERYLSSQDHEHPPEESETILSLLLKLQKERNTCATLRAEIARLRKILEEKEELNKHDRNISI